MSTVQSDHTNGKPIRWLRGLVPGLSLLSACIESGPAVTSVPGVSTADPRATATPGPKTTEQRFQRARLMDEEAKYVRQLQRAARTLALTRVAGTGRWRAHLTGFLQVTPWNNLVSGR